MAKASPKKSPVGSSGKMKDTKPGKLGLGKLAEEASSLPTFNHSRMDKLPQTSGSGGVKK